MSENLRNFTKAMYGFDAVVRRAEPGSWDNQSPCAGWSAADVLDHVIGVTNMIEGVVRGEGSITAGSGGPQERWAAALDGLMEALDHPGILDRVSATPFGEMTIDEFVATATFDPLTHTWDLAEAVGVEAALNADLVAGVFARLAPMEDMLRRSGRFGDAIEVSTDDDVIARYLAFTGRAPSP